MGFLKPKTVSTPTNQFAGQLNTAYSPSVALGNNSTNFLAGLLGVPGGDSAGADSAFANYKEKAGFAPALAELQKGVTGGAAAQGLLNSGSTQKALLRTGANLDQGMFGNFLQSLAGLSGIGLQGGSTIAGAGNVQNSQQPSTASSILSGIGGIASIFGGSDRRVKQDIIHLASFPDGLGVYSFKYLPWFDPDERVRIGVMADEVAKIRPWALGPTFGGFSTVNYGAL